MSCFYTLNAKSADKKVCVLSNKIRWLNQVGFRVEAFDAYSWAHSLTVTNGNGGVIAK